MDGRNQLKSEFLSSSAQQGLTAKLCSTKLDAIFEQYLKDQKECLERAQISEEAENSKRSNRAARRRQQQDTNAALQLDADMRMLCESVEVTLDRYCGICNRIDSPDSGCGFGGNSPNPTFVENIRRYKTYAQR
jgi:hypothetical protein